jgi:hypothetical protein
MTSEVDTGSAVEVKVVVGVEGGSGNALRRRSCAGLDWTGVNRDEVCLAYLH